MKYYNLNIRKPEIGQTKNVSHCKEWLDRDHPKAPIFYMKHTIDEIISGQSHPSKKPLSARGRKEAREFCEIGRDESRRSGTVIVTIDDGCVWIYQPHGVIQENEVEKYPADLVKSFPVKILKKQEVKAVPFILASMKSNQTFARGTFTEITSRAPDYKYIGNILAIEKILQVEQYSSIPADFSPLDCLSSLEFETLIAKILEANGCFVASYKGGFLKDMDLIAKNYTEKDILIDNIVISPGENNSKSFQLKLVAEAIQKREADYYISCRGNSQEGWQGREWVWKQVEQNQSVKEWLMHATEWIPEKIWSWS